MGWGGMIACLSLSSGDGGVHGGRRCDVVLRMEMIQLFIRCQKARTFDECSARPRSPHDGRELGWPYDAGPLRASVPGCCHNAAM